MIPRNTNSNRPGRKLVALGLHAAVWTAICTTPSSSAASYPVTFPWRGDALDPGVYFRSNGHTGKDYGNLSWGIDFHAAKWVSSNWRTNDGGGKNEDEYIFGVPLYSPIDGEIVACWRTAPDKSAPGVDYDLDGDGIFGESKNCSISGALCKEDSDCPNFNTCVTGHDASPLGGGNHLQIRDSSGDYVILFAHMQYDSIPAELCPLPSARDDVDTTSSPGLVLAGADGWPDVDTDDCNTAGMDGWQRDTILPTPVPIQAGDFLGRVGHSGRSTDPHLHMQVKPLTTDGQGDHCEGDTEELVFYESWSQMCASGEAPTGGWSPLDAGNPLEPYAIGVSCDDDGDCDPGEVCSREECVVVKPGYCFLPDAIGIQEDHDDLAVAATNLHFTTHADGEVLVYQSSGNLRLRSYDLAANGDFVAQSTRSEGAVHDVAVARPLANMRHVVVSIRGSNDDLKHIPYTVATGNGTITRVVGKEKTESGVLQVESTPSPAHGGYVVAIEDEVSGDLRVIDYHVDANLNITRNATDSGLIGPIDDVAITTMSHFDGVVTAEITAAGGLVLRSFDVPAGGGVTAADDQITLLGGTSVTIDVVPTSVYVGDEYVVTSLLQANHTLRIDSWAIDSSSGTISWVDSDTAGEVSEHDGAAGSTIVGDFVVGLRDSDDEFRVVGWDLDWTGQLRRNSTRDLTAVTEVALVGSAAGGGNHLVAARTDSNGDLHLFSYAENYNGWF
ncbi:hypothetical protein ACNOYE_40125 [Nannocystaceae bacterium ST9]